MLKVDGATRAIARVLYERVAAAPIVSPHGHVPVAWLASDEPFRDPVDLLVRHDHYVTRLLHAAGVDMEAFARAADRDPRAAWRTFADHWHLFAGTASGYWLEDALAEVLEVGEPLTSESADRVYDAVAARLAEPAFRPRALFRRFGIEALATTDDPLDDLAAHASLNWTELGGRVLPTFRPDRYLDPDADGFASRVRRLVESAGEAMTFAGYLAALEERRRHFIDHGAVSADHGGEEPYTADLEPADAERLFRLAVDGTADAAQQREFRGHMLLQMARMSVEDGLVMTLHTGVLRNHSTAALERFGPNSGHDIPLRTDFVRGLRPLLERFGLVKDFHLVLFTVDETTYSREIAPLAGFYPSVFIGAPWWFLDAPDAMERFRSAVTETAGFYRGSGFVDDTRAFLSIPVRHDAARRTDAGFLARLVAEGRVSMPQAEQLIDHLVCEQPRQVFKL
nr:glucuronate isomerase [Glycomyces salinus]